MREFTALLATDMDGTIIPMEVSPRRTEEIDRFRDSLGDMSNLGLAYVTGRDLPLALKGLDQHQLPRPHVLVCDVGTSVYQSNGEGFERDLEYEEVLKEARGNRDVREVRAEFVRFPELQLQPEERQTESKLCFRLSPEVDHQKTVVSVQELLAEMGGTLQAVYSIGAPHGTGLLDILPAGVAKDFADRSLQAKTGVATDSLVYAGDSGNDLAALLAGFNSIVVGNATSAFREEVALKGKESGVLDRLYFSRAFYAAGVLEGCEHFGLL